MTKRERPTLAKPKTSYFVSEKTALSFVSSGCTLLDCALGGGYVLGRITNVVGDKSTAKTALATEALINFIRAYPNGAAAYRDAEAAFDPAYAAAMGLNLETIDFGGEEPLTTVEGFARDLDVFIEKQVKADAPGIYVLDSLDALSDEAEMEADIGKGTYGTAKAKALSTFFRKTARKLEKSKILLLIVSQVRDNIGAMFGDKHKRSGGRALDFYASQIMFLSHLKTLKRTINKVERPYGILIKAKLKKNKVALPFREAEFEFSFGYGIEDLGASVTWLREVGRLKDINIKDSEAKDYLASFASMSDADYRKEQVAVSATVKKAWAEIETEFLPSRSKYA
jgi:recombination protein RecA